MLTAAALLVALLAVIATAITGAGLLRGQVRATPPRCRACGHPVMPCTGEGGPRGDAAPLPTRCTECGGDLDPPDSILWFARVRSGRLIAMAAAMPVLCLLAAMLLLHALAVAAQTRQQQAGQAPLAGPALTLERLAVGIEVTVVLIILGVGLGIVIAAVRAAMAGRPDLARPACGRCRAPRTRVGLLRSEACAACGAPASEIAPHRAAVLGSVG